MCKSFDQRAQSLFGSLFSADRVQLSEHGQLVIHLTDLSDKAASNAKSIISGLWERMSRNGETEVELQVATFESRFDKDFNEKRVKTGDTTLTFVPELESSVDKHGRENVACLNCSTPGGYRRSGSATPASTSGDSSEALKKLMAA